MHAGIHPSTERGGASTDPTEADGGRARGSDVIGRRIPASVTNTSPPRFNSSLPSASPTMSALSNTFSSLVGLVGAKTPTDSTGSDEAPRQGGPWKGGHFDRLPARWNSSKSETVLLLHTHASISLFALPSSIGTSTNSDLREVLRVSSASLGDGIVLGARVVPPPTPTGTDWSLLVVLDEPVVGAGRRLISVTLLSLPCLAVLASRSFSGSVVDIKTSSHTVAFSTMHPSALHVLHPATLQPVAPTLVSPTIALSEDRKPIFDIQGRTVVYASSEAAPKGSPEVLRSSAGGRKWEEGVAGLSRLSRARRTSGGADVEDESPSGQTDLTSNAGPHRRSSASSSTTSKSTAARSVVMLALPPPGAAAEPRRLLHFASDGTVALCLSPSSSKLLLSNVQGHHSFSVVSLRPSAPWSPTSKPAVWETHVLHRGLTPAHLEATAWSVDERWVGTKTSKGTTHFWLLGQGGSERLSVGRDVCVRVRQAPSTDESVDVGFAFTSCAGEGSRQGSKEQDVMCFDSANGQHLYLHRLAPPAALQVGRPVVAPRLSPSTSSQGGGSALSLMMSASRKAQALVSASTAAVLEAGQGEGAEWEVARWDVGSLAEEGGAVPLSLLSESSKTGAAGDPIALALSHAEIETSSPSTRILPGPLYLSHQFAFSTFTTSSLPSTTPLPVDKLATARLVVRSEVVVSRSPALEAVHTAPSSSIESFNETLSSAIHSPLNPLGTLEGRPIIPSYPNGDGLTTSPRSWKSTAVGMPIVVGARSLGDGLVKVRQEVVGRIASPSGSVSSRSRGRLTSARGATSVGGGGGLSFDDDVVYDSTEYQHALSTESGSFGRLTHNGTSAGSTDPDDFPWEDEDDEREEGYRALVEEEASFDELVFGVMEDDGREGEAFLGHGAAGGGGAAAGRTSMLGIGSLSVNKTPSVGSLLVPPPPPPPPTTATTKTLQVPPLTSAVQQSNSDSDALPLSEESTTSTSLDPPLSKADRKAANKARKREAVKSGLTSAVVSPVISGPSSLDVGRSTSATG